MKKLIPIILLSLMLSGCLVESFLGNFAVGLLGGEVIEQVAKDNPED